MYSERRHACQFCGPHEVKNGHVFFSEKQVPFNVLCSSVYVNGGINFLFSFRGFHILDFHGDSGIFREVSRPCDVRAQVMQLVNDNDKGVFNGEIGVVSFLNLKPVCPWIRLH